MFELHENVRQALFRSTEVGSWSAAIHHQTHHATPGKPIPPLAWSLPRRPPELRVPRVEAIAIRMPLLPRREEKDLVL